MKSVEGFEKFLGSFPNRLVTWIKRVDGLYVIREIILIFIGINLAIWFDEWNTSKNNQEHLVNAIAKIKEEIRLNEIDLEIAQKDQLRLYEVLTDYVQLLVKPKNPLPQSYYYLANKYPVFFELTDSIEVENAISYKSNFTIEFTDPNLSNIAWETAKTASIINEFNYNCLYNLQFLYEQQKNIGREIIKANDAIQKNDFNQLLGILNILNQYNEDLVENYATAIQDMESCN